MEPDDLLCSRNAQPQKDAREQADRSSCSQSPHDKAVVARRAQWRTICLLPLGKLGNRKALALANGASRRAGVGRVRRLAFLSSLLRSSLFRLSCLARK